jgi:hypothetical protein
MVEVQLLVGRTGHQQAGDIITVSLAEAERMVAAGQAVMLQDEPKPKPKRRTSKRKK